MSIDVKILEATFIVTALSRAEHRKQCLQATKSQFCVCITDATLQSTITDLVSNCYQFAFIKLREQFSPGASVT